MANEKTKNMLSHMIDKITKFIGFGYNEKIYQNALCYELRTHMLTVKQDIITNVLYGLVEVGNIKTDIFVIDKDEEYSIEIKTLRKVRDYDIKKATKNKIDYLININNDSFTVTII